MNKKTVIIIGIILTALIVAAAILSRNQGGISQIAPTPIPTLAPPAPTGIFPQPTNAVYSFASAPSIPASIRTYTFQPATIIGVETTAANAASALGLSATPSAVTRGGSYMKTWSRGNDANLVITQTGNTLSVVYHQTKSAVPPGTYSPEVAVQQFLLPLIPSTQNISLRASGTTVGPFDGLLVMDTPPPTSFTGYLYSYVVGGVPILTDDLSITPVSVIADSGGIVRSASITPPPGSVTQYNSINLISKEQILATLGARRGVLLDVHSPQAPQQGVIPAFTNFVISDIKVVYAPKDNLLLPAFYITGSGTTTQGGRQDATIFLWGYPEGVL